MERACGASSLPEASRTYNAAMRRRPPSDAPANVIRACGLPALDERGRKASGLISSRVGAAIAVMLLDHRAGARRRGIHVDGAGRQRAAGPARAVAADERVHRAAGAVSAGRVLRGAGQRGTYPRVLHVSAGLLRALARLQDRLGQRGGDGYREGTRRARACTSSRAAAPHFDRDGEAGVGAGGPRARRVRDAGGRRGRDRGHAEAVSAGPDYIPPTPAPATATALAATATIVALTVTPQVPTPTIEGTPAPRTCERVSPNSKR